MRIFINQKPVEVSDQATIEQVATELQLPAQGIAVAIDYQVVPRCDWTTHTLGEGAELMIIQAVSGG